jgi:hypothetical protein
MVINWGAAIYNKTFNHATENEKLLRSGGSSIWLHTAIATILLGRRTAGGHFLL